MTPEEIKTAVECLDSMSGYIVRRGEIWRKDNYYSDCTGCKNIQLCADLSKYLGGEE